MFGELPSFSWSVPVNGFVWLERGWQTDNDEGDGLVLTETAPEQWLPGAGAQQFGAVRRYDPLKETALYRLFSEVEPTPDGVMAFASKYGLLGHRAAHFVYPDPGQVGRGEPLMYWVIEIAKMRQCIEIYDALKAKKWSTLRAFEGVAASTKLVIAANEGGTTQREFLRRQEGDMSREFVRDLTTRRGLAKSCREWLQNVVNAVLAAYTRPGLEWVKWERNNGSTEEKMTLRLIPTCLLGALYVEFAAAISMEVRYFRCECRTCRKFNQITKRGAGGKRAGARFCNGTCKTTEWRLAKDDRPRAGSVTGRQKRAPSSPRHGPGEAIPI